MSDPLTKQVGGEHYLRTVMQPFEFTMANGYDACAHTILKYVARHKTKAGLEDLKKALHVVEIRRVLEQPSWKQRAFAIWCGNLVALLGFEPSPNEDPRISIDRFIYENKLPPGEAAALTQLDMWVRSRRSGNGELISNLRHAIISLAKQTYGEDIE